MAFKELLTENKKYVINFVKDDLGNEGNIMVDGKKVEFWNQNNIPEHGANYFNLFKIIVPSKYKKWGTSEKTDFVEETILDFYKKSKNVKDFAKKISGVIRKEVNITKG